MNLIARRPRTSRLTRDRTMSEFMKTDFQKAALPRVTSERKPASIQFSSMLVSAINHARGSNANDIRKFGKHAVKMNLR